MKPTIIAELGSSPMPAWDLSRWCLAAAEAGADAVKVQLFRADVIYPEPMREAMRPREFPRERLAEFVRCAHAYGLTAGASVFDADAVDLAVEWCDWLKLAASQEDNLKLYTHAWAATSRTGKWLYRSQSTFGNNLPLLPHSGVAPLYAIQKYPAPMPLSMLRLVQWVGWCRENAGPRWGWSSHTTGISDSFLAARLGASVIEKHFALDPSNVEAEHSLSPAQFEKMVRAIRAL